MKRSLFLVFIFTSFLNRAQISLTSLNMPNTNDTMRLSTGDLLTLLDPNNTLYTSTGTNYSWTFDSLKATGQRMREFKSPGSTPYPFFLGSSYGEKTSDSLNLGIITFSNIYNFYKKNTASYNLDGIGMSYMSFPIPNFYSNKDELYFFPLSYGDRDSSYFKFSTISTSLIPTYKKEGYRITEVDGWGTITSPLSGIPVPCIRVTSTAYSQDSIVGDLAVGTFTIPLNVGFPNHTRTIQWMTLTERVPYMEVSGSILFNTFIPTAVHYRDIPRQFVGVNEYEQQVALAIYPNPATTELNIMIPQSKELLLEIYSASGQLVLKKKVTNSQMMNKHTIDVSGLSQGLYSGRLGDGSTVQNFKFIKQ